MLLTRLEQIQQSHPTCVKRFTPLTITVNVSELRLETYRGEEMSVVDIVALRPDIVLRPLGSTVPEFVPGDIHHGALHTFADRPVMMDHPADSEGNAITALTPKVLEASQFGHVFEPRYDNELGLILPTWLSGEMSSNVEGADDVISDLRDGKSREISIGAWVYLEILEGTSPSGEEYGAIWIDYDADHIAFLKNGDTGACSNAAGCGPILLTKEPTKMSAFKRASYKAQAGVRRLISPAIHDAILDGEFSDREIGDKLSTALMGDVDSDSAFFGWVLDIYIKKGVVVYKTFENSSMHDGMDLMMWQRSYKMDKSGIVTLKDDAKRVIGLTPVLEDASTDTTVTSNNEGGTTMISKEVERLVGVVIGLKASPFDDDAKEYLESKDEKWLGEKVEQFKDDDCGCEGSTTQASSDGNVEGSIELTTDDVTVARADFDAMNTTIVEQGKQLAEITPAATAWMQQLSDDKKTLVDAIAAAQPKLDKSVYEGLGLAPLRALHESFGLAKPRMVHDYTGATGDSTPVAGVKVRTEVPNSMKTALDKRSAAVN